MAENGEQSPNFATGAETIDRQEFPVLKLFGFDPKETHVGYGVTSQIRRQIEGSLGYHELNQEVGKIVETWAGVRGEGKQKELVIFDSQPSFENMKQALGQGLFNEVGKVKVSLNGRFSWEPAEVKA